MPEDSSCSLDERKRGLPVSRRFLRRVKSGILRFELFYRTYLKLKYGAGHLTPALHTSLPNGILQSPAEWQEAAGRARQLHLPLHRAAEKNWDHIAAVDAIVGSLPKTARILDAGAEFYSNVLPALFVYGYRDLYGINLSFADPAWRGPIRYLHGDITHTEFPECFFDAVTCMSVIEHGVPLDAYFHEMYRVLKPGGILITSTDYYPDPIDTTGKSAHGAPIKIFSKPEVEAMLALAADYGLETTAEIDLDCHCRAVRWEVYDLEFTFLIFTLRKPAA
jgi:SAM-dependent methyltransferase